MVHTIPASNGMTGFTALRVTTSVSLARPGANGVIVQVTERRKAMVSELSDWIKKWRNTYGRPPTQQEIDDFMYSWRAPNANRKGKTQY